MLVSATIQDYCILSIRLGLIMLLEFWGCGFIFVSMGSWRLCMGSVRFEESLRVFRGMEN